MWEVRATLAQLARLARTQADLDLFRVALHESCVGTSRPRFCIGLLGMAVMWHNVPSVRTMAGYILSMGPAAPVSFNTVSRLIPWVIRRESCDEIEDILCMLSRRFPAPVHPGATPSSQVDRAVACGDTFRAMRMLLRHGFDPDPVPCFPCRSSSLLLRARAMHPSTLPVGLRMARIIVLRFLGDPGHVVVSFLGRDAWRVTTRAEVGFGRR